jgi:hypothetical protein
LPCCLLELTNAGKIIFTIFTALKKNKPLVFQVITVLSGLDKKKVEVKQISMDIPYAGWRRGMAEKQIFFK